MKTEANIPYKFYLEESELPTAWYNVRADMKNKPAPLLNPGTLKPMTAKELDGVFCDELVQQELDDTTAYIPIPDEIREYYRMYRPSPLCRAYRLEEALGTPAKIYYKFEGNNTSGSHKLNSAIAQAYYAKKQGLKGVTTETGAGQWGTALSMACSYFGLDCKVYMVKVSYEQKPFRREVMRTYGASVTPSPSMTTNVGRKILAEHPDTTGSLGCAISEAVEVATSTPGYRYVLGSVLNQVLLHQSVIGLETKTALDKLGVKPDIIIGCAGGGSNLGGLISPFMGENLRGEADYRFIAVEPASCPSFTRGKFAYDFCDTGKVSTKEERLDWPVTDEERNSDKGWGRFGKEQICRLKIRRMKEEWAKDLVAWPWCISQVVKAHEDCPELQAVLDEYHKPVVIQDQVLGELTLDKDYDTFEGEIQWCGKDVSLSLEVNAESKPSWTRARSAAKKLLADCDTWDKTMRELAAKNLTELANNWLSQDEENPRDPETDPITEEELTRRISLTSLSVTSGGSFTAWFDCDEMFTDHAVTVYGSLKKGLKTANIEG